MSASTGVVVPGPVANEIEVLAKATRRRFSAEYKPKILREAEACTQRRRVGTHHLPVACKLEQQTQSVRLDRDRRHHSP